MMSKSLHYFEISIKTRGNASMKLILVRCVLELTFRQNLHLFYQCRYYLLLFAELCMNKPNHKQFHTCIVNVLIDMSKKSKRLNNRSLTFSVSEWLEAPRWKAMGRWFDSRCRHIFSFCFFRLLPVALSSAVYTNEIKNDINPE